MRIVSTPKTPKFFFIDAEGIKHTIYDDFSSDYHKELAIYLTTARVETLDSQGFVTGEFVLHDINEQVAA